MGYTLAFYTHTQKLNPKSITFYKRTKTIVLQPEAVWSHPSYLCLLSTQPSYLDHPSTRVWQTPVHPQLDNLINCDRKTATFFSRPVYLLKTCLPWRVHGRLATLKYPQVSLACTQRR